jgi:RNA polymerase sigma factor (sigma-70 family)
MLLWPPSRDSFRRMETPRHDPLAPRPRAARLDAEAVLLEHLAWIDRVAAMACRRNAWATETEDFAAWARMKMMEDDYAVLRKFRGESNLRTYIATVVVRYFHAYSRERRGRWRSSAAAERLGPLARELEMLVRRDGYRLAQAGEKLRTAGRTTLSDAQLARLLAELPEREPLRPVEVGAEPLLGAAEARSRADERVAATEDERRRREAAEALERAMAQLSPEERMIVRMHLGDGRTLAEVARTLRVEQKPLYRLVPRLRERLRTLLVADGISPAVVRATLDRQDP